jgi:hypothetical protein
METSDDAVLDDSTLEGLVENARCAAQAAYTANDNPSYEHPPMWTAHSPEGTFLIATPWTDEESKQKTLVMLRLMFAVKGVTHYVLFSEAWRASDRGEDGKTEPSKHPDRVECAHVIGADRSGRVMGYSWDIIREPGKPPRLSDKDNMVIDGERVHITGRMTELLNGLPPIPDDLRPLLSAAWDRLSTPLEEFLRQNTH